MNLSEVVKEIISDVQLLHIILFAIGIICMVCEMFEPGIGVFGIVGVIVLIIDVFVLADSIVEGVVLFAVLALIVVAFIIILLVLSSHGIIPQKLVLKDSTNNSDGYVASNTVKPAIGALGVAKTDLRPAGKVSFDDLGVFDVVSSGEFITAGTRVKASEVEGNKIVVTADGEDK